MRSGKDTGNREHLALVWQLDYRNPDPEVQTAHKGPRNSHVRIFQKHIWLGDGELDLVIITRLGGCPGGFKDPNRLLVVAGTWQATPPGNIFKISGQ